MNNERFFADARRYFGLAPRAAAPESADCDKLAQCIAVRVYQSKFSRANIAARSCGSCRPRQHQAALPQR